MAVALIPLRGGSKSIPRKNIKPIAGRPLCAWVIEAACSAHEISEVYVSTDSQEIKDKVNQLGYDVKIIDRPSHLATDESSTEAVMLHFASVVNYDVLCTIQATSPLLSADDLDMAIKSFHQNRYDSMLSAVRSKHFLWDDNSKPLNYDPTNRPRRQDFKGMLVENGAFYLTRNAILQTSSCRLGGHIGIFEMDPSTSIELDDDHDWVMVEALLQRGKRK